MQGNNSPGIRTKLLQAILDYTLSADQTPSTPFLSLLLFSLTVLLVLLIVLALIFYICHRRYQTVMLKNEELHRNIDLL